MNKKIAHRERTLNAEAVPLTSNINLVTFKSRRNAVNDVHVYKIRIVIIN